METPVRGVRQASVLNLRNTVAEVIPHYPDNQFTNDCEVVSLICRPRFIPKKIPDTHFCYILSQPQGRSAAGRIS
jgi:hypothetical protein